jgi:hypothetical protein
MVADIVVNRVYRVYLCNMKNNFWLKTSRSLKKKKCLPRYVVEEQNSFLVLNQARRGLVYIRIFIEQVS